ncbi:MAG: hypothetical protein ACJ763_17470 [Bdellovibrionia bacterium]
MRFIKFLSVASFSLGSATALAQTSAVPLKNISSGTLMALSGLSQTRLPVHKHISCTQIYQSGHHVFTDCQDSDGNSEYSNKLDYGWLQNQPACAITIEEPVVRIERDAGLFKTLFGSFLESDIKVAAGELLELDGGYTSLGKDSVELEGKAQDGNKVHIKCFDPEAKTSDLDADLSGLLQFKSVVVKVHANDLSIPTERAVESSDDASSESSSEASDAASDSADSSELSTGSDAHPADGKASYPAIDPSDVVDLERNS